MDVLGIRVDNLSREEILEKVRGFLSEDRFHQVATVNPEFLLAAQGDLEFGNILNNCDLNVADGFGISCAFFYNGNLLKSRMAGIDLMQEILKIAAENNYKIFLAANSRGLSSWKETRDAILKKLPKLEIAGANLDKNVIGYELLIADYNIVLCNFGAPYQEKFLNSLKTAENSLPRHLSTEQSHASAFKENNRVNTANLNLQQKRCGGKIKLAVGVGGSFDYFTGKVSRAPLLLRKLGFEWLWRLIQQPWRIKRIWNAVIIFPLKIIFRR